MARASRGKLKYIRKLFGGRVYNSITEQNVDLMNRFFPEMNFRVGDRWFIYPINKPDFYLRK